MFWRSGDRRVRHERNPLTLRDARQQVVSERLEVRGFLVLSPSGFVLVKLEYEKRRWIGRRAIRQKELHARLRHGRLDQGLQCVGNDIFLTRLCDNLNGDDENLIQLGGWEWLL